HNDVGNFVVYKDGQPVIIDVGVETYTAKTFGPDRYSIWTMQSSYHNLPTINGVSQKEGRKYAAKDVSYHVTDAKAALSMEIAGAYPPAAGVQSWRRTVTLERGNEVIIQDAYELKGKPKGITLALMTCREPVTQIAGTVLLGPSSTLTTAVRAEVVYDPVLFSVQIEPIDIDDPQLQSSWGKRIWRILLTMKGAAEKGECVIRVR
ncbi:MAG TPA: heparinase II/III family protein, partial [Bacteroidota bacterium]|nr:heparinase II/III family protein [Bacteroidota bacterium]